MSERYEPAIPEAFFDALAHDLRPPAPVTVSAEDANVARVVVALEQAVAEPTPQVATRIWTQVLESSRRAKRPPSKPWMALRAAAVLLLVLLGGSALAVSHEAQAQVRRLACLVLGLGVRACDNTGLVSTEAASATSNGVSAEVLGSQASAESTLVRMRLSGLPVPGAIGAGQGQRFENAVPLVQQVQQLPMQLRDSRGRALTAVASAGEARARACRPHPRVANLLSTLTRLGLSTGERWWVRERSLSRGRADLAVRVTTNNPSEQQRRVHVPLPPDIGSQVPLTFSGAAVEVRGPWHLAVPPGPGGQQQ